MSFRCAGNETLVKFRRQNDLMFWAKTSYVTLQKSCKLTYGCKIGQHLFDLFKVLLQEKGKN